MCKFSVYENRHEKWGKQIKLGEGRSIQTGVNLFQKKPAKKYSNK